MPEHPVVFAKFPTSLAGPDADVVLPSDGVDWEVELVVVIGARAPGRVEQALGPRRRAHGRPGRLERGSSAGPAAAVLARASPSRASARSGPSRDARRAPDPDDLAIAAASTARWCRTAAPPTWSSRWPRSSPAVGEPTLYPGDVIFTGTPAGVGWAAKPRASCPGAAWSARSRASATSPPHLTSARSRTWHCIVSPRSPLGVPTWTRSPRTTRSSVSPTTATAAFRPRTAASSSASSARRRPPARELGDRRRRCRRSRARRAPPAPRSTSRAEQTADAAGRRRSRHRHARRGASSSSGSRRRHRRRRRTTAPADADRLTARADGVLRDAGRVRPRKLGHVVLGTTDLEASQRFFIDGIGFKVSDTRRRASARSCAARRTTTTCSSSRRRSVPAPHLVAGRRRRRDRPRRARACSRPIPRATSGGSAATTSARTSSGT